MMASAVLASQFEAPQSRQWSLCPRAIYLFITRPSLIDCRRWWINEKGDPSLFLGFATKGKYPRILTRKAVSWKEHQGPPALTIFPTRVPARARANSHCPLQGAGFSGRAVAIAAVRAQARPPTPVIDGHCAQWKDKDALTHSGRREWLGSGAVQIRAW